MVLEYMCILSRHRDGLLCVCITLVHKHTHPPTHTHTQMKEDDLLGKATFTVQDIINKASGDEDVVLDLVLQDGLVKKKSDTTVTISARFVNSSGVCSWCVAGVKVQEGDVLYGVLPCICGIPPTPIPQTPIPQAHIPPVHTHTDEVTAQATAIKTSDKTDAILADVGLQTNGDMFKDLLKTAGIAAGRELEPVLYFDNEGSHTQVGWEGLGVEVGSGRRGEWGGA